MTMYEYLVEDLDVININEKEYVALEDVYIIHARLYEIEVASHVNQEFNNNISSDFKIGGVSHIN